VAAACDRPRAVPAAPAADRRRDGLAGQAGLAQQPRPASRGTPPRQGPRPAWREAPPARPGPGRKRHRPRWSHGPTPRTRPASPVSPGNPTWAGCTARMCRPASRSRRNAATGRSTIPCVAVRVDDRAGDGVPQVDPVAALGVAVHPGQQRPARHGHGLDPAAVVRFMTRRAIRVRPAHLPHRRQ